MTFKLAPLPFLLMMMGTAWDAQADAARPVFLPAPFPSNLGSAEPASPQARSPIGVGQVFQPVNAYVAPSITQARQIAAADRVPVPVSQATAAVNEAMDGEAGAPAMPAGPAAVPVMPAVAPQQNMVQPPVQPMAGPAMPAAAAPGAMPGRMAMPVFMMPMMMPMGYMVPAWRGMPAYPPSMPMPNPRMAMPQPVMRPFAPMPGMGMMPGPVAMPTPARSVAQPWPGMPMIPAGMPPQWAMMRPPGLPVPTLPTTPAMPPVALFQPGLAARPSRFAGGMPMMPVPATLPMPYPQLGAFRPAYPVVPPAQGIPPMMAMPMMGPQAWRPMAGLPQFVPMPVAQPAVAMRPLPQFAGAMPPQAAMMAPLPLFFPPATRPVPAPVAGAPMPGFMPWMAAWQQPVQPAPASPDVSAEPPAAASGTVAPAELSAPAAPAGVASAPAAQQVEVAAAPVTKPDQPLPLAPVPEKAAASSPAPATGNTMTRTARTGTEPDPCAKGFKRVKSRVRVPGHDINASLHHKARFIPCGGQAQPVRHVAKAGARKMEKSALLKVRNDRRVCFIGGRFRDC